LELWIIFSIGTTDNKFSLAGINNSFRSSNITEKQIKQLLAWGFWKKNIPQAILVLLLLFNKI